MQAQQALDTLLQARNEVGKKVALYPYGSFRNLTYLNDLVADQRVEFKDLISNKRILDIGCGDGDMAFLCEMLGAREVAAIDWADTNFNFMQGVRALRDQLHSKIHIMSGNLEDMDMSFLGIWDMILFLGTLYHLPNPIRVLRKLSVIAAQIFSSTRVFDVLPGDTKSKLSNRQVGYLVTPVEANNDNTNWWILSEPAVKVMFERSGWRVLASRRTDHLVGAAEPADPKKDGRMFLSAHSVYL
jgi:tRNA (mo5U34)-methyltransferase